MEALEALAQALEPIFLRNAANKGIGYKHDVAGSPATTGFLHGPGGYLTFPGVDPAVFHTVVMSRSMIGQLPAVPSVFANPVYQTLVGVGADSSTNETRDVCDDAIQGGILSGCKVWAPMGRVERSTAQLELNRLGMRNDRADPVDLQLVNSPMLAGSVFAGQMSATSPADVLTNDVSLRFWERNISFQRKLTKMLWTGNPANNAGDGYKEFTGFELLVNTGYKHAETGVRCYAMDSDVKNFGYKKINDYGAQIVEALSYIHMTRVDLAERTGMTPVRWVLAMRANLFWELAAVWPCAYMTTGCNFGAALTNSNATLFMTADEQIRMRDDMRANRYLIVNGDRIEVILDDGISEKNGDNSDGNFPRGCFASDIFFIPMSVVGGRAVTYFEYFDYSNPSLSAAAGNMGLYRVEGAFITTVRQHNWCIQWQSKIEPRLIMRTPWLAGRLQNVVYCPTQHTVEPFPENPYAFSQGATSRSGPSYYNFWS